MFGLGPVETILIIGVIILVFVIFGPKQLPKLGKMFGSTMKEVRKGVSEFSDELNTEPKAEEKAEEPTVDPNRKVAKVIYEDEEE